MCKLPTTEDKASHFLLQILIKRGPDAFQKFLKCLVEAGDTLHFIAEKLDPTAVARYQQHEHKDQLCTNINLR